MITDPGQDLDAKMHTEFLFRALWPNIDWLKGDHHDGTPSRFVAMLRELTTPCDIKWKDFPSESNEMVVQSNIAFHSLCAHHVVPFIGHAHIGYIPAGRIVGLSKLARVVKHYSANLTVQEELTSSIADFLEEQLEPEGVAVVMEAEHMCMSIRGVQSPGTKTTTSCMYGAFADHSRLARTEFFNIIQRRQ